MEKSNNEGLRNAIIVVVLCAAFLLLGYYTGINQPQEKALVYKDGTIEVIQIK